MRRFLFTISSFFFFWGLSGLCFGGVFSRGVFYESDEKASWMMLFVAVLVFVLACFLSKTKFEKALDSGEIFEVGKCLKCREVFDCYDDFAKQLNKRAKTGVFDASFKCPRCPHCDKELVSVESYYKNKRDKAFLSKKIKKRKYL